MVVRDLFCQNGGHLEFGIHSEIGRYYAVGSYFDSGIHCVTGIHCQRGIHCVTGIHCGQGIHVDTEACSYYEVGKHCMMGIHNCKVLLFGMVDMMIAVGRLLMGGSVAVDNCSAGLADNCSVLGVAC